MVRGRSRLSSPSYDPITATSQSSNTPSKSAYPELELIKPWSKVMVISGGYSVSTKEMKRSVTRKWKEIRSTASNPTLTVLTCRPTQAFSDQDLPLRKSNKYVPLIISVVMLCVKVKRILVDQGSSVDLMFTDFLNVLKIVETDLTPYQDSGLFDFNGG